MKQTIIIILLIVAVVLLGFWYIKPNQAPVGSVVVGNDYYATSTYSGFATSTLVKSGYGSFGSMTVTVAGSAGGKTYIYDATTTNVLARTGQPATSTITIASFPPNIVAGNYVFDVVITRGLLIESSINVGSTTFTFR